MYHRVQLLPKEAPWGTELPNSGAAADTQATELSSSSLLIILIIGTGIMEWASIAPMLTQD